MSGAATKNLRSAYVAETTPGTIVSTPGFTTSDDAFDLKATPAISEQYSLAKDGARSGQSVQSIPVSGTAAGKLPYGTLDDWLASLLQGAWATNTLKDGNTRSALTVENTIPAGEGGTNTMLRYRGVEAVAGRIAAEAGGDITYSLDLLGMGSDNGTTSAIAGATYTDPTNDIPLVAGTDVGTIDLDGYTEDCISDIEIEFGYAGREPQPKLGSNDLCGITLGAPRFMLRGNFYLEANFLERLNAARANHSAFSVTIPLGSVSGSKYTIEFHQCMFADANVDFSEPRAKTPFLILPQYSDSDSCTVEITRAVS